MVNYKEIADEVDAKGYSDYLTAYTSMSQEVVESFGEINGNKLRIWAALNPVDYANLKGNAATNVVAEIALLLIQTPDSLLDLNETDVQNMIGYLQGAGIISEAGKNSLYEFAKITTPKWEGLQEGHISNAIQKRQGGLI